MPFLPNIGPGELLLILIIALVVLGPGKLPDVAQSLGKSLREFRKAASDVQDSAKIDAPAAAAPAPQVPSAQAQPVAQPTPSPNVPAVPATPAATEAAVAADPSTAGATTTPAEPVAVGSTNSPDSDAS